MATDVWIVACKQPPNLNGTTLSAQCPVAQRITVQTTLEFFEQQGSLPEEVELDPQWSALFFVRFLSRRAVLPGSSRRWFRVESYPSWVDQTVRAVSVLKKEMSC